MTFRQRTSHFGGQQNFRHWVQQKRPRLERAGVPTGAELRSAWANQRLASPPTFVFERGVLENEEAFMYFLLHGDELSTQWSLRDGDNAALQEIRLLLIELEASISEAAFARTFAESILRERGERLW